MLSVDTSELRIEQLQTLPPGLQMMLLNTEAAEFGRKSPEHPPSFTETSAEPQAIAGGYEERLIEARGTWHVARGAVGHLNDLNRSDSRMSKYVKHSCYNSP